jgi:hypothetical protein
VADEELMLPDEVRESLQDPDGLAQVGRLRLADVQQQAHSKIGWLLGYVSPRSRGATVDPTATGHWVKIMK